MFADLSAAWLAGIDVRGADFTGAITTGVRAAGIDWQHAAVPPAELPETRSAPPAWLRVLLNVLVVAGLLFAVWKIRQRRPNRELVG